MLTNQINLVLISDLDIRFFQYRRHDFSIGNWHFVSGPQWKAQATQIIRIFPSKLSQQSHLTVCSKSS
jgi:hypothetical protein